MAEINLFKIPLDIKGFKKGKKVEDEYFRIYSLAERIAIHEAEQFKSTISHFDGKPIDNKMSPKEMHKLIMEKKKEKTEFHINQMINLLKIGKERITK